MNVIRVPNSTELISGIGVGFNCFTGQQMTSALAANPTVTQLGLDSQSFFKFVIPLRTLIIPLPIPWVFRRRLT